MTKADAFGLAVRIIGFCLCVAGLAWAIYFAVAFLTIALFASPIAKDGNDVSPASGFAMLAYILTGVLTLANAERITRLVYRPGA